MTQLDSEDSFQDTAEQVEAVLKQVRPDTLEQTKALSQRLRPHLKATLQLSWPPAPAAPLAGAPPTPLAAEASQSALADVQPAYDAQLQALRPCPVHVLILMERPRPWFLVCLPLSRATKVAWLNIALLSLPSVPKPLSEMASYIGHRSQWPPLPTLTLSLRCCVPTMAAFFIVN